MIRDLNIYGEIDFDKNETLVTMPFYRLGVDDVDLLEENYKNMINQLNYSESFFYADSISAVRDRAQFNFNLEDIVDFHIIHKIPFEDLIPYFYSMVALAREDTKILWQRNNFALDMDNKRVKAFIFEFDGFPLYVNTNNVDGLKELILLALTNKKTILGKPKRVDFIQQNDCVISFSEDILRCKSIDEIEETIKHYENDIEYERRKEETRRAKKKKNNILYAVQDKVGNIFKNDKPKKEDIIKQTLKQNENNDNNKSKSNGSFIKKMTTPKGMVVTIIILFTSMFLFSAMDLGQASQEDSDLKKAQNEIKEKDKVLDAYRLYIEGGDANVEQAYAKLDSIEYKDLEKSDKEILIDWYIEQGKLTRAISTDPDSAYQIGDTLYDDDDGLKQLEELQDSIKNNKVVNFDVASIKSEYQTMIDNNDIKYNERRAKAIVEAYVMTNQIEDLDVLLDEIKDEDITSYENIYKYRDRLIEKYESKLEINDEINNLSKKRDKLKEDKSKKKKSKKGKKKNKKTNKKIKKLNKEIDELKEEREQLDEEIKKQ